MILTYKLKHNQNLFLELEKGKQVALFALKTKSRSSKDISHLGLPSAISNQILKKYSSNRKLKRVSSVKLTIPAQAIKYDQKKIIIRCLKLEMDFNKGIEKICQIELDNTYAYISCRVVEANKNDCESWIGVDLNATGHCLVAGNPTTGKVLKLGKKAYHIHQKYKNVRKQLQKKRKYRAIKKLKNKESRVIRDIIIKYQKKLSKKPRITMQGWF